MADRAHFIRAKNGDTSYFKRTPVDDWEKARDIADGDSVLGISVKNYHLHCAKVIYRRCPDLLYYQSGRNKFTPLHHAAIGADKKPSIIKFVISVAKRKLYRKTDIWKNTALQAAIDHSRLEAVKLLIEVDPDHLYRGDASRGTPLLNAVRVAFGKKDDEISVKVRRAVLGTQANACKIRTGESGWTVLHQATSTGDRGAIEDIIQFCPDSVHVLDNQGRDFIDIAITSGHSEVVKNVLRKNEIWDSILKGNNFQGIENLRNFLSDHGKKEEVLQVANTMSKRERELCISPKHLQLYRKLVNQFGEIVEPSKFVEDAPAPLYEALGCFLSHLSDMMHVNPRNISQEDISNWEKMAAKYRAMGLQLRWFQKLVAQYRCWLPHLHHLDNEIKTKEAKFETKQKELQIIYSKMSELRTELQNLRKQRDTCPRESDPFSIISRVTANKTQVLVSL